MNADCIQFVGQVINIKNFRYQITVPKREVDAGRIDFNKKYLITLTPIESKKEENMVEVSQ